VTLESAAAEVVGLVFLPAVGCIGDSYRDTGAASIAATVRKSFGNRSDMLPLSTEDTDRFEVRSKLTDRY
jgi:hypothetical protein